jgi:hypothetical protein
MSQVRYRVAALTLGGLLLGVPLLTNGTASAEQVEGGSRQVVFGGSGMLGISCRSTPNVNSLTVPADSTVRVVNRTGHNARLQLSGDSRGTIPDDGSTDVVFRRGTTAVQLSPSCALGAESTPVLVTATPGPVATTPDPEPGPSDDDATPATPGDSGSPSASGTGSSLPDSSPPTSASSHPQRTSMVTSRPGATRSVMSRPLNQAAASALQTMPLGGAASPRVKTRITRGTATAAPTFSGMPPGDQKAIVPGVPTIGLPTMSEAAGAAPSSPFTSVAAAEPVAEMRPMTDRQPVGLLALVAGVCVLGVAIGAIRSFVSERASRSTIA